MSAKMNIIGRRFGRLTVVSYHGTKNNRTLWKCLCDCGRYAVVSGKCLNNGNTKSCGCLRKQNAKKLFTKHGKSGKRIYMIWAGVKTRCYNKTRKYYKYYGGRGITMCDEWKDDFQAFYNWSMSNGYNDNLTIDRIDVNGNYEPNNCRWVTMKQQNRNSRHNIKSTYNNETHCLSEWCEILGLNYNNVKYRLYNNWSIERALELEVK